MVFIVYSQVSGEKLGSSLGMPDYSYYFVLRGFLPVLRDLGQVVVVSNPEKEVDPIYEECRNRGEGCFFISFSPPHKSAIGLKCPTVCVFAWEFDRIPDEVWDDNPKNDWRNVFADHGSTITLSNYSAKAVRRSMGEDFHVEVIPVPVWDFFEDYRSIAAEFPSMNPYEVSIKGNIFDSRNYISTADSFEMKDSFEGFNVKNWKGETLQLGFNKSDDSNAYLGGFYSAESWGTWSSVDKPWVLLPYSFCGLVHLEISARAYGHNVNKEIDVKLGDECKRLLLRDPFIETLTFHLKNSANIIRFSGLDLSPVGGAADPRTMGIGLCSIVISGDPCRETGDCVGEAGDTTRKVSLEGVIYTSVLNPADDRKNWSDMVKAFCIAFRDVEDATLVLKMTHHSLASFLGELHFLLQIMGTFKCRIVVLHGYLDKKEYEKLVESTHFYVNSSWCEGLCLPLMEFMSCGKPAIAPEHTSFADYIDESTTLIVRAGVDPYIWRHDPRELLRTLKYRIDFESLIDAYMQSYDITKKQPDVYSKMAKSASSKMKDYTSNYVIKRKLENFFNRDGLQW